MMMYQWCAIFLFSFSISQVTAEVLRQEGQEDILAGLNQTLNAIHRLLSFFEEDAKKVNLDAIYGLRVAEGAFKNVLTEHDTFFWQTTPETKYFHQQLLEFSKRAASVNNRAQISIKKQGEFYYSRFKDVVDKPWSFFTDFGKRKLSFLDSVVKDIQKGAKHKWSETVSDRCMSEVLGSNIKHTQCLFSTQCIQAITDERQTGYGLTHQILFLTLSLVKKCEKKYSKILVDHGGLDVYRLTENRCVLVLDEMLALERTKVPEEERDLYIEQAFVCAIHGYEEVLSLKRLRNVLSWQQQTGCFGNETKEEDGEGLGGINGDTVGRSGSSEDRRRRQRNPESFSSMRHLLVDVVLEHGCSAHESGVAVGLLGVYTKWQLTKLNKSLQARVTTPTRLVPGNQRATREEPKMTKEIGTPRHVKNNEIYVLAIVVSFVTTVLTLAIVVILYKLCKFCCNNRSSGNPYKQLSPSVHGNYA